MKNKSELWAVEWSKGDVFHVDRLETSLRDLVSGSSPYYKIIAVTKTDREASKLIRRLRKSKTDLSVWFDGRNAHE